MSYIMSDSYIKACLDYLVHSISLGLQEVLHELGKLYLEPRERRIQTLLRSGFIEVKELFKITPEGNICRVPSGQLISHEVIHRKQLLALLSNGLNGLSECYSEEVNLLIREEGEVRLDSIPKAAEEIILHEVPIKHLL